MLLTETVKYSAPSATELISFDEALNYYEQNRPPCLKSGEDNFQKATRVSEIIASVPKVLNRDLVEPLDESSLPQAGLSSELYPLSYWIRVIRLAHFNGIIRKLPL